MPLIKIRAKNNFMLISIYVCTVWLDTFINIKVIQRR